MHMFRSSLRSTLSLGLRSRPRTRTLFAPRRHESAIDDSLREGGGIPVLHACTGPSSAPGLRLRTFSNALVTPAAAPGATARAPATAPAASASAIDLPRYCTHHQQPAQASTSLLHVQSPPVLQVPTGSTTLVPASSQTRPYAQVSLRSPHHRCRGPSTARCDCPRAQQRE